MTLVAFVLGLIALVIQPHGQLPREFVEGGVARGRPVIEEAFLGIVWDCDGEECYAGLQLDNGEDFVTGP